MSANTRTVTPTYWTQDGEAAKDDVDNRHRRAVIFGAIPGEAARVEIDHSGELEHHARFMSAHEPHPRRRPAPCPRFRTCGGCSLMHLDAVGQHDARRAILAEALRNENLSAVLPEHIEAEAEGALDYRHSVKLVPGRSDHGHLRVGVYARGTRHVVPIPECVVVTPILREVMKAVAFQVISLEVFPWEPELGRGTLRHVLLRQSRSTGQVLVTLITARNMPLVTQLAEGIAAANGAVAGVCLQVTDHPGEGLFAPPPGEDEDAVPMFRLRGRDTIEEDIGGVRISIGPADPFSQNPAVADRLAHDLIAALSGDRQRPVVGLHSGVGALILPLAKAHGWALGLDPSPGAVARAQENARGQHVPADFLVGELTDQLPEVKRRVGNRSPVIVVDPPRGPLSPELLQGILDLDPARVVYLSSDPRALARDLAALRSRGWSIDAVKAYDMNPQTAQMQMVAMLSPAVAPPLGSRSPQRRIIRG
jgi:23S rRNA (uracil1939-C5)-methyltransferase